MLPSISGKNLKLPESGWRRDGGSRDEDKMKGGSSGVLEGQKGGVPPFWERPEKHFRESPNPRLPVVGRFEGLSGRGDLRAFTFNHSSGM